MLAMRKIWTQTLPKVAQTLTEEKICQKHVLLPHWQQLQSKLSTVITYFASQCVIKIHMTGFHFICWITCLFITMDKVNTDVRVA